MKARREQCCSGGNWEIETRLELAVTGNGRERNVASATVWVKSEDSASESSASRCRSKARSAPRLRASNSSGAHPSDPAPKPKPDGEKGRERVWTNWEGRGEKRRVGALWLANSVRGRTERSGARVYSTRAADCSVSVSRASRASRRCWNVRAIGSTSNCAQSMRIEAQKFYTTLMLQL